MPVQVISYANYMAVALEPMEDGLAFRQKLEGGEHKDVNATWLREAFLSVTTPEDALRFLKASGRFRYLRDRSDSIESVLTWREFQQWQELVRIVLVDNFLFLGEFESPVRDAFVWGPPEQGSKPLRAELYKLALNVHKPTFDWLLGRATSLQIVSDEAPKDPQHRLAMIAEVMVDTSLDAILASIYIDTQSGIEFELCSLPDCSNVYEVTSKHQRDYYSQACAHKASVRRRRAEQKKSKNKKESN